MLICYLDQNKWIALAKALKLPKEYPAERDLLDMLVVEVKAGRLLLPLSFTNIYETRKITSVARRRHLAWAQASLSQGIVLSGRHRRLEAEVEDAARLVCGWPKIDRTPHWFLSTHYIEAVADLTDARLADEFASPNLGHCIGPPSHALYQYLVSESDAERTASVRRFSSGSDELRQRIEKRRARWVNESTSMRRRAYSALLMIEEIDAINKAIRRAGVPWNSVGDIGEKNALAFIDSIPIFYTEREIVMRLEAQHRPIHENDFRDMAAFCAALPYSHAVVGENQFVNLSKQARLDAKYGTKLFTRLSDFTEWLGSALTN